MSGCTCEVRIEMKQIDGDWYYTLAVIPYDGAGPGAQTTGPSFSNLKDALADATRAALHLAGEGSAGNLVGDGPGVKGGELSCGTPRKG